MPDPSYLTWNDKWLLTGDMVNCSECHAAQFMTQRDRDFEHRPTCSRLGTGQKPYMELLAMLQAIQEELPEENVGHRSTPT